MWERVRRRSVTTKHCKSYTAVRHRVNCRPASAARCHHEALYADKCCRAAPSWLCPPSPNSCHGLSVSPQLTRPRAPAAGLVRRAPGRRRPGGADPQQLRHPGLTPGPGRVLTPGGAGCAGGGRRASFLQYETLKVLYRSLCGSPSPGRRRPRVRPAAKCLA